MDLSTTKLFARRRPNAVPYPTREAAFAAVAAGRKALVQHPRDARFAAAAKARKLAVIIDGDLAYALRDDFREAWRIPAIATLRATTRTWTDDAERQLSALLGYTVAQQDAWLALHREHQAAWGALTLYTLLDRAGVRALDALGRRAFEPLALAPRDARTRRPTDVRRAASARALDPRGRGAADGRTVDARPTDDAATLDVFVHRTLPIAPRPRVPHGFTLARFAIPHDALALHGRVLARATVDAASINALLVSPIQLRTGRGWR